MTYVFLGKLQDRIIAKVVDRKLLTRKNIYFPMYIIEIDQVVWSIVSQYSLLVPNRVYWDNLFPNRLYWEPIDYIGRR